MKPTSKEKIDSIPIFGILSGATTAVRDYSPYVFPVSSNPEVEGKPKEQSTEEKLVKKIKDLFYGFIEDEQVEGILKLIEEVSSPGTQSSGSTKVIIQPMDTYRVATDSGTITITNASAESQDVIIEPTHSGYLRSFHGSSAKVVDDEFYNNPLVAKFEK